MKYKELYNKMKSLARDVESEQERLDKLFANMLNNGFETDEYKRSIKKERNS